MQFFSSQAKLGILGGGQLGKMLLYTTRKWDINTHVLDPSADAPSRIACDQFIQGDFKDYQTVYNFGKTLDVLTIEIEHVNTDALRQLEKEGVQTYPNAATLELIQTRSLLLDSKIAFAKSERDFLVSQFELAKQIGTLSPKSLK